MIAEAHKIRPRPERYENNYFWEYITYAPYPIPATTTQNPRDTDYRYSWQQPADFSDTPRNPKPYSNHDDLFQYPISIPSTPPPFKPPSDRYNNRDGYVDNSWLRPSVNSISTPGSISSQNYLDDPKINVGAQVFVQNILNIIKSNGLSSPDVAISNQVGTITEVPIVSTPSYEISSTTAVTSTPMNQFTTPAATTIMENELNEMASATPIVETTIGQQSSTQSYETTESQSPSTSPLESTSSLESTSTLESTTETMSTMVRDIKQMNFSASISFNAITEEHRHNANNNTDLYKFERNYSKDFFTKSKEKVDVNLLKKKIQLWKKKIFVFHFFLTLSKFL